MSKIPDYNGWNKPQRPAQSPELLFAILSSIWGEEQAYRKMKQLGFGKTRKNGEKGDGGDSGRQAGQVSSAGKREDQANMEYITGTITGMQPGFITIQAPYENIERLTRMKCREVRIGIMDGKPHRDR